MKLELSHEEVTDLMSFLGAAREVFTLAADRVEPEIAGDLCRNYAERAQRYMNIIASQHNLEGK